MNASAFYFPENPFLDVSLLEKHDAIFGHTGHFYIKHPWVNPPIRYLWPLSKGSFDSFSVFFSTKSLLSVRCVKHIYTAYGFWQVP